MSSLLNTYKNHSKEKSDIILDPLQAIFQLALLSHCEIGSKISIYNNILYIQSPSWKQSIVRTYYADNKEELYFLFNVINRFPIFYNHLKNNNRILYDMLISKAVTGIDILIQTYNNTKITLKHTLEMYKLCLCEPEKYNTQLLDIQSKKNDIQYDDEQHGESEHEYGDNESSSSENEDFNSDNESKQTTNENDYKNIDKNIDINDVFININKLYNNYHINIMENTLNLLNNTKKTEDKLSILNGINQIFKPLNNNIHKWIQEKIVLS
jgi:hypothetical protein